MYQEIKNKIKFNLCVPLNVDSLSSYLTPILAQYNIPYNEFLLVFFNDFKKFLSTDFDYILISNLLDSQPLSKYNLRIRVQVNLLDFSLHSVTTYQLNYKPLFLNHILLYYFKSCYRKKYALEVINILKLGLFFWWNENINIINFTKFNYIVLRWFIVLRVYGFKKYSLRLKSVINEFYNIKYFNHFIFKNKNNWNNVYNLKNKYTFLLYKKYINTFNHIYVDNIMNFNIYNMNNIKFKFIKRTKKNIIFFLDLFDFEFNNIKFIQYKKNIYFWSFFKKNFVKNFFYNINYLLIINILLLCYYFKEFYINNYAHYKFFIFT